MSTMNWASKVSQLSRTTWLSRVCRLSWVSKVSKMWLISMSFVSKVS